MSAYPRGIEAPTNAPPLPLLLEESDVDASAARDLTAASSALGSAPRMRCVSRPFLNIMKVGILHVQVSIRISLLRSVCDIRGDAVRLCYLLLCVRVDFGKGDLIGS